MKEAAIHTEMAFENAIEHSLITQGRYAKGNRDNFNRQYALFEDVLFQFLAQSQPKAWEKINAIHGPDLHIKLLYRLNREMENRGVLDVIRNGFVDNGVKFQLAYFKPETSFNPETAKAYAQNILTVTRQVYYSTKNNNSVDMVLSLNGIPVATVELKNQFTGQTKTHAQQQFIEDRDARELLFKFKRGALVHFAVDTDEVFLTTHIKGKSTFFLPFNQGVNNGKGNPANPNGYKTSYLWEQVWKRDSWLDIIGRFIHLQQEEKVIGGKKIYTEKIIFPRYHQLDVVRKLAERTKTEGSGKNYLIQHSAGSGKSNSIAWLAYRLFSLHNTNDEKVFHSVIVITDRRVLDKQLQDTIYQFEHKQGVVQKIDKTSAQLGESLSKGIGIVITTLQKFPFVAVLDEVQNLPDRRYAIIVDEAHSSQGGEASKKLKEVLTSTVDSNAEDEQDFEDEIRKSMLARGQQPNLSFFAFTATPKAKTLEVFGEPGPDGKPKPFHLYSMRQAIEEEFILDVLKNYMTYKTFFRLSKAAEDDPHVNKKKASRAIARFVSLHPHNLSQKTEVMVEHFRQIVAKEIGGKAKAMVVTSSRPHAVRYYFQFKKYIADKGYTGIKPLVAFSGKVKDPDNPAKEYTEAELNGFGEKELPKKFDSEEYKLLLVAEKYQTGFGQPLLHTMYVDKKLSGVKAVQTLSRLNRTCPGKEDTFVLDFANETDDILEAFHPYYEVTTLEEVSDPNRLYDLKYRLEERQIIWQTEVDNFCKEYFKQSNLHKNKIHALLNAYIDPAVDRCKALETEEEQDDFKHTLTQFVRAYSFLSQIIPFQDVDLEKLFAYGKLLLSKLPRQELSERFKLTDEVSLEYYRLQKVSEGNLALDDGEEYTLKPATEAGLRTDKEEKAHLSEIINVLNDRFGTEFTESDKLFFDQVELDLANNEVLQKQGKNNSFENFKHGLFKDLFFEAVLHRMDKNGDITNKILGNKDFNKTVSEYLLKKVYERINSEEDI